MLYLFSIVLSFGNSFLYSISRVFPGESWGDVGPWALGLSSNSDVNMNIVVAHRPRWRTQEGWRDG